MDHVLKKNLRANIKLPKREVYTVIAFSGNYSSILFVKLVRKIYLINKLKIDK